MPVQPPSSDLVLIVRGWLLIVLGSTLIVYGMIDGNGAQVGFGFTLLGVEPLTRASTEIQPTPPPPTE